ncbi:MAG: histidinol-phosphate transaminase [Bacillota bacterium]|nr:histidinol-phosphate transaminase [Bacillota bacterium]
MSRFFSSRYDGLTPYEPGEQPQDQKYIKLNTNESPFPPSPKAVAAAREAAGRLQLYSDPDVRKLTRKLAEKFDVEPSNIIIGNGSDEILNFAFMAFCDEEVPAVFPDITYGFYPVFAEACGLQYVEMPLREDFSIDISDYFNAGGTVFIANPNAHTGVALSREQIEEIIRNNPDNVVVVDEAYVDFGAESCVDLINKYDNLLVIQTMSKSRSLAGARLGYGIANSQLITDMNTLRNSTNPYNINSMTMAAGEGVLEDEEYTAANCRAVMKNRDYTVNELKRLGFALTDSVGNFIFMKHPEIDGGYIYETMKSKGVLIRHFTKERICQYNRVTIGSRQQMERFIQTLEEIITAGGKK